MLREELEQAIAEAEKMSAHDPAFASRASALAHLENVTIQPDLATIETRRRSLQDRLESANAQIVAQMRERIASKNLRGPELSRALLAHAGSSHGDPGYDALDLLVGMLLDSGNVSDLEAVLEKEMVAYQPTPARAILDAIDRARIGADDVLCDLGSGLGWVTILVPLITGAQCTGIEIEPAYVRASRLSANALHVSNAHFVIGDLLDSPLPDAGIYFSYTPLRGALMEKLIERLREKSYEHPIRICTLGPCTNDFMRVDWLKRSDGEKIDDHEIAVFNSVS